MTAGRTNHTMFASSGPPLAPVHVQRDCVTCDYREWPAGSEPCKTCDSEDGQTFSHWVPVRKTFTVHPLGAASYEKTMLDWGMGGEEAARQCSFSEHVAPCADICDGITCDNLWDRPFVNGRYATRKPVVMLGMRPDPLPVGHKCRHACRLAVPGGSPVHVQCQHRGDCLMEPTEVGNVHRSWEGALPKHTWMTEDDHDDHQYDAMRHVPKDATPEPSWRDALPGLFFALWALIAAFAMGYAAGVP
jgi:hypothetical protein